MSDEQKVDDRGDDAGQQEALFKGFVSLVTGVAMQQLGKVANPLTGKVERNLDVARAWIETLKMMRVKTRGNLSEDEQRFLETNIANLQMNYVDEAKKPPEKPAEEKEKTTEEQGTAAGKEGKDQPKETDKVTEEKKE